MLPVSRLHARSCVLPKAAADVWLVCRTYRWPVCCPSGNGRCVSALSNGTRRAAGRSDKGASPPWGLTEARLGGQKWLVELNRRGPLVGWMGRGVMAELGYALVEGRYAATLLQEPYLRTGGVVAGLPASMRVFLSGDGKSAVVLSDGRSGSAGVSGALSTLVV